MQLSSIRARVLIAALLPALVAIVGGGAPLDSALQPLVTLKKCRRP